MFTFGGFSAANFAVGMVLGYVVLRLNVRDADRNPYFRKVAKMFILAAYSVEELIRANIRMALYTVGPLKGLRPGILAVPLADAITDAEITALASLVTLTPGTLSMEVSEDRRYLYVHFMHVDDPEKLKREITEGFERRILEVTR